MKEIIVRTEIETAIKMLGTYLDQAERLVNMNKVTLVQAEELAEYLTAIRSILEKLKQSSYVRSGNKRLGTKIQQLRDQYFEMEGFVKEKRNDLSS